MSKRIIISYNKLTEPIKEAIKAEFPNGIESQLSRMKHVVKGYFFEGFVFDYDDITYLIEWKIPNQGSSDEVSDAASKDDGLIKEIIDEPDIE